MCVCVCVCVCMSICVCLCVCMSMKTHVPHTQVYLQVFDIITVAVTDVPAILATQTA